MKHYDIEINKEMVLSTCHVREETLNDTLTNSHNFSSDECNVRLQVECCLAQGTYYDINEEFTPFPEELINLLHIAKSYNCKWLVLDCDGPEVEGLQKFTW